MADIQTLNLDSRLAKKVYGDGIIKTVEHVLALSPLALRSDWNLTDDQMAALSGALVEAGYRPLAGWAPKPRAVKVAPVCEVDLNKNGPDEGYERKICGLPRMKGKRKCHWHWLLTIPVEEQIVLMDNRAASRPKPGDEDYRARVPKSEWPSDGRWCAECQSFIPNFYTQGSKCYAHGSRAAHGSRVQNTYGISRADYEALLAFQKGRCYICHQKPRGRRLAVDHDHVTGQVRGLLCANDEWGCNMSLRRLLNDEAVAVRALEYVRQPPWARLQAERALSAPAPVPPAPSASEWPDW
jgi:Recombination endonuclease VII